MSVDLGSNLSRDTYQRHQVATDNYAEFITKQIWPTNNNVDICSILFSYMTQ